ncbi:hypothetical protein [Massilia antarctica]|uniref:hypothetical protein n=1 Tax=Massilia antarctica TaxID=2765360 RepID=UPI0006BB81C6|nr:hypothetical protein [Massilia sp. H27-R4]MCY0912620.1 hypothetical protein [Massilia sp. H27-R4]CUI03681.1 putative Fe-S oxidoreductase [Janthinobacterium sp. CG23_2]CUU27467.1 putative Fe-S oxidoreductase [Janthinobacterium sp. CG23_2]
MQHRDDKPAPASGRPSLLSTEQQAEAARASAEARQAADAAEQATLRASQAKRSRTGWLAGGAAVAALCAGAGLWWANDSGKIINTAQRADVPDSVAPVTAVKAAGPVVPVEPEVPAAAILDQASASPGASPGAPPGAPPVAAASKGPSLKDMLNAPSEPAPKSAEEELTSLLASAPADAKPAAPKARGAAPAVPAALARAGEKKAPLAARAPGKEGAPKALAKPGGKADAKVDDASLLAALVAHSKEREDNQRSASNANAGAPTSLKQCKQLNAAQAEQCRVRLCAGNARNDAECKPRLPAKVAD